MSGRSQYLGKNNQPKVFFNKEEKQWYLFTNVALSEKQKLQACKYAYSYFTDKAKKSEGKSRIDLLEALTKLNSFTIKQHILPNEFNESYLIKQK
jgi:hypothetical protein